MVDQFTCVVPFKPILLGWYSSFIQLKFPYRIHYRFDRNWSFNLVNRRFNYSRWINHGQITFVFPLLLLGFTSHGINLSTVDLNWVFWWSEIRSVANWLVSWRFWLQDSTAFVSMQRWDSAFRIQPTLSIQWKWINFQPNEWNKSMNWQAQVSVWSCEWND